MAVQTTVSIEQFEQIAALPENAHRRLEFIGGEIVELVSNSDASEIAMLIALQIGSYIRMHKLGRLTGADGGYKVSGEYYIPDVAFISNARQPERPHTSWNPLPPDLAVEVVSPTDRRQDIADKVANYLLADTLVWYVYPEERQIKVYAPGQPVKTLGVRDVLDGGSVLPGFKLALEEILLTK